MFWHQIKKERQRLLSRSSLIGKCLRSSFLGPTLPSKTWDTQTSHNPFKNRWHFPLPQRGNEPSANEMRPHSLFNQMLRPLSLYAPFAQIGLQSSPCTYTHTRRVCCASKTRANGSENKKQDDGKSEARGRSSCLWLLLRTSMEI